MTAVEGQDGWFTITLNVASVEGLKVIFNNGAAQTPDLVYAGLNYWVGETAYETLEAAEEAIANAPEEPEVVGTVVYLIPNSNWNQSGARFAVYMWGTAGQNWVDMVKVEGEENLYTAVIPEGYTNIIFCRMNPNASANNWNNKWNQTSDLTLQSNGDNCYAVAANTWDKGNGTWSTYAPVVDETPEVTPDETPAE